MWAAEQIIHRRNILHQELFSAIDVDNSGFINIKEMIEFLQSVCDDEVDESEVRGIFSKMDATGDRTLDFWEFEVRIHNYVAAVPASAYLCFKIATTTKPTLKLAAIL